MRVATERVAGPLVDLAALAMRPTPIEAEIARASLAALLALVRATASDIARRALAGRRRRDRTRQADASAPSAAFQGEQP